jgi:hypothetical protein
MAGIGHNNPPEVADGPYAIYRHEKHSSASSIAAASRHMTRSAPTPNADPGRASLNRVLIGSDDPSADVAALVPAPDAVGKDGTKLRRSNSVLAVEVLITASPEWWAEATPTQQQKWLDSSVGWLVAEYGQENVAHLRLHGDEKTPHITGFVVPLDPETGRLNARRWIGGKDRCSQQQTDYAAAVEDLGIQRGIKGSKATHQRVQSHYADLNRPVTKVQIEQPPRVLLDPAGWAAEQRAKVQEALAPAAARLKEARNDRQEAKAARATARAATGRAEAAEAALADAKAIAADMRALPLPDVLQALGFRQHKDDPLKWQADGFAIGIGDGAKAGKWFDHRANIGRGGAIDLVQHVMGTDFKGSLAWLADRFGPGAAAADVTARIRAEAVQTVRAAVEERPPFTPPVPAPEYWLPVRRHLVAERGIPGSYVDKLHERGDLYADQRRNAVFVCRDQEGTITGAELKGTITRPNGTRFTGMAPGSRKDAGGFRIGDIAKAAAVYIVESAVDAISLARLLAIEGKKKFSILSAAGTTPDPRTWFGSIASDADKVCAFDNDEAGEKAATSLRRHGFSRLRPTAKDWNDDLRNRLEQERTGRDDDPFTSQPSPPSIPSGPDL